MSLKKIRLDFGPWEPDAARLGGAQTAGLRNAVPASSGWRPFMGPSAQPFPALEGRVLAAFARRDGEDVCTFAATENGILVLQNEQWVSRWSGAALSQERSFAEFGPAVYALFGGALLKAGVLGGSVADFEAVEGAPHADVMGVVRDFLVLGRLDDAPGGIRWSGLDRADEWPEPGTDEAQYAQSDRQVFPTGGRVQAIVGGVGGADGLIFLEGAIHRASYVGTPYIFQFDHVDRRRGLLAPQSAVLCGGQCCFLSEDGWFATDGASVRPIGMERVDRWFFENCEASRLAETRGVHDAQGRFALWTFASPAAPAGVHDRALIYSYSLDRWGCAVFDSEAIFCDWTRGVPLEDLDERGTLDGLPLVSLDAASLRHRRLGTFIFDGAHRLCGLDGEALEAVFDTPEHSGGRMFLHGFVPLVDGGAAEAMPVFRDRPQEARRFGTFRPPGRDGLCPHRLSARRLGARVRVPAGQVWSHAVGVEALLEAE